MKDTDFSELHDAQAHALGEALPMVDTIKEFEPNALSKQIKKPCILIEVAEMAPTGGVGNIIWLNAQFQAHCLLPVAMPRAELECQNFAAVVMKTVHKNTWGLSGVKLPEEINAFPGIYSTKAKGFRSWIVSWWQTIAIGEQATGAVFGPDNLMLSEAPRVGAGHKDDYEVVKDGFINPAAP